MNKITHRGARAQSANEESGGALGEGTGQLTSGKSKPLRGIGLTGRRKIMPVPFAGLNWDDSAFDRIELPKAGGDGASNKYHVAFHTQPICHSIVSQAKFAFIFMGRNVFKRF